MKISSVFLWICLLFIVFSCTKKPENSVSKIEPKTLLKNFDTWWSYTYDNVNLSDNFIPLNADSKVISKEKFLEILASGGYIPVPMTMDDTTLIYKLHQIESPEKAQIVSVMQDLAQTELEWYKREGTKIPKFNFTDLNGNIYTNENTKGKTLVLKCWFIHCMSCVAEIPALNKMVAEYKNRKDLLFISLAYDSKEQLKGFLAKKKFDYAVVPVKESFIVEDLKVSAYPTHFIINKEGIIKKIVDRQDHLAKALIKEIGK